VAEIHDDAAQPRAAQGKAADGSRGPSRFATDHRAGMWVPSGGQARLPAIAFNAVIHANRQWSPRVSAALYICGLIFAASIFVAYS
jgi:hypothetical protein